MSLPTNGGTDRDAFGSVAPPVVHLFSSLSRPPPPSYTISRSQIITNGLSRKRSHAGDLLASSLSSAFIGEVSGPVSSVRGSASTAVAVPSLSCQVPSPAQAKRLRREPPSPTSVGEVSDAKKMPPAKTAGGTTPGAAQMQSMLRGLHHVSVCNAYGCPNPLCVSTRTFVNKVKTHSSMMAGKATHDANKCGACKLWSAILRVHASTCSASASCLIPGCSSQQ